jgi:hypothetical protein
MCRRNEENVGGKQFVNPTVIVVAHRNGLVGVWLRQVLAATSFPVQSSCVPVSGPNG